MLAAWLARATQVRGRFGALADIYRHGKGLVAIGAGVAWCLPRTRLGPGLGRVREFVVRFGVLVVITCRRAFFLAPILLGGMAS